MRLEKKNYHALCEFSKLLTTAGLAPVGLDSSNLYLFCQKDNLGRIAGVVGLEAYGDSSLLRSFGLTPQL
jgi:hypothetical protein